MRHLSVLELPIPRPVTRLHQIEVTSRCDLRCTYCTSPKIVRGETGYRPAVDMTLEHFLRCLVWAGHYVDRGTQTELNLAGIGESTIHPRFLEFVGMAREALGPKVTLVLATNGVQLSKTPAMVPVMARYKPFKVWVSLHRPEKAGKAVRSLRERGLLAGVSADPSLNANDWAGQVDWHVDSPGEILCPWVRRGQVMATADGRLTTCCLDAQGTGVVGHVDDDPGSLSVQPYDLCRTCYQDLGIKGWDQQAGKPT